MNPRNHQFIDQLLHNMDLLMYLDMDFLLSVHRTAICTNTMHIFLRTRKVFSGFSYCYTFSSLVGFLCVQKTVVDLLLISVI